MKNLNGTDIDRIIEMAWEDRTTFDAILETFGLNESEVISLMRRNLKPSSFRLWITVKNISMTCILNKRPKQNTTNNQWKIEPRIIIMGHGEQNSLI